VPGVGAVTGPRDAKGGPRGFPTDAERHQPSTPGDLGFMLEAPESGARLQRARDRDSCHFSPAAVMAETVQSP